MDTWRLVKLSTADAYTNMAVDEAVMKARIENRVSNTLRLYQWNPSAVSIGRFQILANEVYLEACRKQGVDIVHLAQSANQKESERAQYRSDKGEEMTQIQTPC